MGRKISVSVGSRSHGASCYQATPGNRPGWALVKEFLQYPNLFANQAVHYLTADGDDVLNLLPSVTTQVYQHYHIT